MNSQNSRFSFKPNSCLFLFLIFSFFPVAAAAQNSAVTWHSLEEAQKLARQTNKKVLIFAEEKWSVYCRKMADNVFSNRSVTDSIKTYFYPVKLDISSKKPIVYNKKETTPKKFARHYHIQATPTTIFLNNRGKKLAIQPGFISAQKFEMLLGFIGSGAFQKMNFRTYLKKHGGN
jgi:thioredoxin-related protein